MWNTPHPRQSLLSEIMAPWRIRILRACAQFRVGTIFFLLKSTYHCAEGKKRLVMGEGLKLHGRRVCNINFGFIGLHILLGAVIRKENSSPNKTSCKSCALFWVIGLKSLNLMFCILQVKRQVKHLHSCYCQYSRYRKKTAETTVFILHSIHAHLFAGLSNFQ